MCFFFLLSAHVCVCVCVCLISAFVYIQLLITIFVTYIITLQANTESGNNFCQYYSGSFLPVVAVNQLHKQ